jgi:hypothetical protein
MKGCLIMKKKLLNLLKSQYRGNVAEEEDLEEEEYNEFEDYIDDPGFIGKFKNQ